MAKYKTHQKYCFAGQPAPCPGYFEGDVLPCICGATGDVITALSQVSIPLLPASETVDAEGLHLLPLSA